MINFVKDYCVFLVEWFEILVLEIVMCQVSVDGMCKYLLCIVGGYEVEIVYIFEELCGMLCIFSQVGCMLICLFCYIGIQKLVCNLMVGEIVGQVMVVCDDLGEWLQFGVFKDEICLVSNVVLMGMGELLYNFDNVCDVMKVVMDGEGISLLCCCIMFLISGIVLEIVKMVEEIGCFLVVLFYVIIDEICNKLVLVNKKWNIEILLGVLWEYLCLFNFECIIFEYVMLDGVNDSDVDVCCLVRLIQGILVKINLILFNEWFGVEYKCSSWEWIEVFVDIVYKVGYVLFICILCGEDIMVVCGQLKFVIECGCKLVV